MMRLSEFSQSNLFASLIFGSIGFGVFIYGKKMTLWRPMTILLLLRHCIFGNGN
ncbi:MAG: hypothetical protein KKD05_03415 [Candidatus Omnitrophica bacterium]|nr:hypothetical protein [Candidatus Omnitrophota bacterium]